MLFRKTNKALATLVAFLILIAYSVADSYGYDEMGLDLNTLEKANNTVMDETRGRYFGFFFNVNFTGYWDTIGSEPWARLSVDAGLGAPKTKVSASQGTGNNSASPVIRAGADSTPDTPTVSSSNTVGATTPAVSTSASIGSGLGGGGGVMQITQVPGSRNLVSSGMTINLTIMNVKDTQTANSIRTLFPSMLGGSL